MISELKKAYKTLNRHLFDSDLPEPTFRIDLNSKPVFRYRGEQSPDIVIGAGIVGVDREEIVDDLLHAMIHICNYSLGFEDCTTNQYHKRAFSSMALHVGLTVMKTSSRGWGITTSRRSRWSEYEPDFVRHPLAVDVQRRHSAYKKVRIDPETLQEFQHEIQSTLLATPRKQFQFKYECKCPPPYNSVRSGRRPSGPNRLKAKCMECGSAYKVVTKVINKPRAKKVKS